MKNVTEAIYQCEYCYDNIYPREYVYLIDNRIYCLECVDKLAFTIEKAMKATGKL